MLMAPIYVDKINHFIDQGWPWVAIVPCVVLLLMLVVPIGIWVSLARRNTLLKQQISAIKYQTEVIKWAGQQLRHGSDPLEPVPVESSSAAPAPGASPIPRPAVSHG